MREFHPGETLSDILHAEHPELTRYPNTHIFIGDVEIKRQYWHVVRPKPGAIISIATGPGGDSATATLRTLAIVAIAFSAPYLATSVFGLSGVTASIAGAGFFAAGMLALNAVLPPPSEDLDNNNSFSQALSIGDSRNRLEPYGTMPLVVGRMRVTPPFAAKPFTELVGSDQYITMLYCISYKNVLVEQLKFGETAIETLEDIEVQYDIGVPGFDTPGGITLYPGTPTEEQIQLKILGLIEDPTPGIHTTPEDTEWITYDITAPLGLLRVSNNGKNEDQVTVTVIVQSSPAGADTWTQIGSHTLSGKSGDAIRRGFKYTFPSPGSYDIRMYRTTEDTDPSLISSSVYNDDVYWMVLRSFISDFPVEDPDAAIVAIRVRATTQFNGRPDNFNCIANQLIPEYEGSTTPVYSVSTDMHDCNTGVISTEEGASGSGRIPPNWVFSDNAFNGTTLTLLQCSVYRGIPVIDFRLDTALNTTGVEQVVVITPHLRTFTDSTLFPPLNSGDIVTTSCFFSELNNPGVSSRIGAYEYTPGGAPVGWTLVEMDGSEWTRYEAERVVLTSGNKGALLILVFIPDGEQISNYRFRLGCPQLEYNVSPASPPAINPEEVPSAVLRWAENQQTSNPASIARYMLTGRGNQRAVPIGDRLDDEAFAQFHDFCVSKAYTFNAYFDNQGTLWDRLRDVCACGRGRVLQPDGKWIVKFDDIQSTPKNLFSPRNSWGYAAEKAYPNEVHAFRVRFINEKDDMFLNDEIIVYRPGFSEDGVDDTRVATLIESLSFRGVTNSDHIWKLARYYSNVLQNQMETHSFFLDPEHVTITPLDRIEYVDDAILVGYGVGRIVAINGLQITLDAEIGLGATSNAVQIRNANGDIEIMRILQASVQTNILLMIDTPTITFDLGDLVLVGVHTNISIPLLVRDIQPQRELTAKIICVPYADGTYVDDGTIPPPFDPHITLPPGLVAPVFDEIRSDEAVMDRNANGAFVVRIVGTFAFIGNRENVAQIGVQYRPVLGSSSLTSNWLSLPRLPGDALQFEIRDVVEGKTYEIRAAYIYEDGEIGRFSAVQTHTVLGKTSLPIAPDSFFVSTDSDGTRLYQWGYSKPNDPDIGKPVDFAGVIVRYWNTTGGTPPDDWDSWTDIKIDGLITESPHESNQPAQGTYKFGIKAVDTGGRLSAVPTQSLADVVLGPGRTGNFAFFRDERSRGWPIGADGTNRRENCHLGRFNVLEADDETIWLGDADAPSASTTWLDIPAWATYSAGDFAYVGEAISFGTTTQTYDWYIDFAGVNLGGATVQIFYSLTTSAATPGEPTTPFNPGSEGFQQLSARNIRWKIQVTGAVDLAALSEFRMTAYQPGLGPAQF